MALRKGVPISIRSLLDGLGLGVCDGSLTMYRKAIIHNFCRVSYKNLYGNNQKSIGPTIVCYLRCYIVIGGNKISLLLIG